MRLHHLCLALTGLLLAPAPVLAQTATVITPGHWGGPFGLWYGGVEPQVMVSGVAPATAPQWQGGAAGYDREGWLRECRHRLGDNGLGGAVIGGVVGGVAGNAVAGAGNRTLGTVAGAAVGAAAGAAIDKAEDRARVADRCEAMLAAPAGAYGYGVPMMLVPVMLVPAPGAAQPAPGARPCKETVVTEEFYEPVSRRARFIPRRAAPDKRVRLAPDKRVPQ